MGILKSIFNKLFLKKNSHYFYGKYKILSK